MSAYPTYDRKVMEAIRQLTLEEMLMALHDLALSLHQDRLRDVGLSRQMFGNEEYPVRPAVHGWEAVAHAMNSAGYETPGFKNKDDLVEFMGQELADEVWAAQEHAVEMMSEIGAIMEGSGVDEVEATEIYDMGGYVKWEDPRDDDDDDYDDDIEVILTDLSDPDAIKDAATKMKEMMQKSMREHPTHPGSKISWEIDVPEAPDDMGGFGWSS